MTSSAGTEDRRYIKSDLPPMEVKNEGTDAKDNAGCAKGCGALIGLIVIVSLISWAWDSVSNFNTEMVPYSITIDVNTGMTDQWVLRGDGCDHPEYEVTISSSNRVGSDVEARHSLSRGTVVDNVFCRYTISGEVPRHSRYWIKVETFVGDSTILAKTVNLPGAGDRISESLRWYHPQDN